MPMPPLYLTTPFVSSHVLPPFYLAILRLTLGKYALTTALAVLIKDGIDAGSAREFGYFSYFTDLSYIGLLSYLLAAGTQTLLYARGAPTSKPTRAYRMLQYAHGVLFSTITTFPIVVTVVYWARLSSSSTFATTFSSYANISQHALNTAFAVFEILFAATDPLPWLHLPICMVILALYLALTYVTHASQGFYTYYFLDPSTEHKKLAGYIVGIALGQCVLFAIVRYVMILRNFLFSRYLPRIRAGGTEALEEWEEVERSEVV
ncbi:hypothetical protein NEOLEDRAFT_1135074 [Neolentinus lepideus HHB14362 ss-1]|uniref:FAR-17a/AIG1-like protein n=1 Tax=Neolentinus lepideus HHB14362 ss-1 TaxID=1314782 RepID=A0A165RUX2_9AGAM|nr:hypothetical protein NEOLEDRAFT_1135074 [Neolentinus lepideus HHB14362 ss-1]